MTYKQKNSGVKREDLFVSTKLWPSSYGDPNAVDSALDRLGLDYIDLLFLHQPSGDWKIAYRKEIMYLSSISLYHNYLHNKGMVRENHAFILGLS